MCESNLFYRQPNNVDVYTGALSEPPMEGSIVGPLLSCILSDQFLRLKRGDSHWYERTVGSQQFSQGINILMKHTFINHIPNVLTLLS